MKLRHPGYTLGAASAVAIALAVGGLVLFRGPPPREAILSSDASRGDQAEDDQARPASRSDVVVIGAGISGLSAALELGRGGAEVTVLDMSSVFGGHAVMSQGGVCIVGTPAQEAQGIRDSPELAYQDFITWGQDADADWVRYYVENSRSDIYEWLTELGVRFEGVETAPGNTVNRFHQPVGRGIGLVTPIYRECLQRDNIHFVWNTKAEQLLTSDGRVVGVLARNLRTGEERAWRARVLILATGGFQSNLEMVRQFWPAEFRFPERILVGSGRNSVGFGHELAQSVGGELVKMDHQWNYFTGIPDPRYPNSNRGLSAANMYGIIVNPQGRRFANLHGWAKDVMPALLGQKQATLWFIFDEASKPQFTVSGSDWADFKTVDALILKDPELVKSAETLEQLAEVSGLPPRELSETIRRYNRLVEQGVDRDFGRFGPGKPAFSNQASPPIEQPPFYAMQAFPLTRKSMGGVAIDRRCRVVDKRRKPIPGLYAVGELTGLAGINGKAALEGTFLGPCIVTGRVAARSVLAELHVSAADLGGEASRCVTCHDLELDLAEPREGYWHFEKVHQITLEHQTDCRQCHAELAPYRARSHHVNPQALAATCVRCHVAEE